MKIYAIGDLHLSGKPPSKPMEIFGNTGRPRRQGCSQLASTYPQRRYRHHLRRHLMGHGSARRADRPELDRRPARAQNHSARQP